MQPSSQPPTTPSALPAGLQLGITTGGRRFGLPWALGSVAVLLVMLTSGCGFVQQQPTASQTVPTVTAAATQVVGTQVLRFMGANTESSQPFTVQGAWGLTWSCSGQGLTVDVRDAATKNIVSNVSGMKITCSNNGSAVGWITLNASGTFILSITGGTWDIVVTDVAG